MSRIVYQTDRRYGTTYAYREGSKTDPDTGRKRRVREYLGRVDPATGDIVPKAAGGGRNRSRIGDAPPDDAGAAELRRALGECREEVDRLRREVSGLSARVVELEERNRGLLAACARAECLAAQVGGVLAGVRDG